MYKVRKVLNNNALLVIDTDKMQEIIFIGTGVGFNKKTNMIVDIDKNTVTSYVQKKGIDISKQVEKNDAIYLEIANEIIGEAAKVFNNFDRNIIITLADHIAFAIQRINSGLVISNPFKNDIKLLFAEEYEIAKNSVGIINNKCHIIINEDEISYITLHIHSARSDMKIDQSLMMATIINEAVSEIEKIMDISIDVNSLAYNRLLTHLKYLILRCKMKEKLKIDMDEYTRKAFPTSYKIAKRIVDKLAKGLNIIIDDMEIGYLAIHIERICS